jgi:hypothetical protein
VSKRRSKSQTTSQKILWLLSIVMVGSMVISLVIVALPSGSFSPTNTPIPSPTMEATEPPVGPILPTVTPEATEPPAGPVLPTLTPIPPVTSTVTVTPTSTITPSGASLDLQFAVCGDSRGNPGIYRQVLDAVLSDGSQFLVHTGDLVNEGTDSQFQAFEEVMSSFGLGFFPGARQPRWVERRA